MLHCVCVAEGLSEIERDAKKSKRGVGWKEWKGSEEQSQSISAGNIIQSNRVALLL